MKHENKNVPIYEEQTVLDNQPAEVVRTVCTKFIHDRHITYYISTVAWTGAGVEDTWTVEQQIISQPNSYAAIRAAIAQHDDVCSKLRNPEA